MSCLALVPVSLGGCPAGWELSRALLEDGKDGRSDLTAHLAGCRWCAAEWRSLGRARAAGAQVVVNGEHVEIADPAGHLLYLHVQPA